MRRLRVLTAGESHGPELVVILEGMPAGLPLSEENINQQLIRRQRGFGSGGRMSIEEDHVSLVSGVLEGKTIGSPIGMRIPNRDHRQWRGKAIPPFTRPRPGHADLTGALKYGYADLRPASERASARETAARVAAGAVCIQLLRQFDIQLGGWVAAIGSVQAPQYHPSPDTFVEHMDRTEGSDVRCPDPETSQAMKNMIRQAKADGQTLGGIIEVAALGLPPGLGSYVQWDRRLDARLGSAVLGVQAVKGVEIGDGFENAAKMGTEAQDPIRIEGDCIIRPTNRSGGLEGGVTNGSPLFVRAAMKPIATTLTPQPTVDLVEKRERETEYERSDFCPVPRAVPILEAVIALVLADALLEKLGGDSLSEMMRRYPDLPQAKFSDLSLDNQDHTWWPT
ncbi:MAG: chorismate synthase [Anaerolineales bacterium]